MWEELKGRKMKKMQFLTVLLLASLVSSCTVYKTVKVTSDPPGQRVHKDGAVIGTTPFDLKVGAGDGLFCTPWYWSFVLEIDPPIAGQNAKQKLVNPCAIPDGATIHFDVRAIGSVNEDSADNKASTGTGFVVSPEGHLITAYHIIKDATQIRIKFEGQDWLTAKVQKHSFSNDVAVLKVNQPTQNYLSFVDFATVKQGQKVFTLGYPVVGVLGDEPKYTEGTISSLSGVKGEDSLIQISVPVQPGNSGGPLATISGDVIGVITSTAAVRAFYEDTGTLPQNVNWAIKADYITPLLPKEYRSRIDTGSKSIGDNAIDIVKRAICFVEAK